MHIGMGVDLSQTIIAGAGDAATLPCCTSGQASDPSYSNSASGNIRYSPVNGGTYCNPNCVGQYDSSMSQSDIAALQNELNALRNSMGTGQLIAGVSNTTLMIGAAGFMVLLLVLKR